MYLTDMIRKTYNRSEGDTLGRCLGKRHVFRYTELTIRPGNDVLSVSAILLNEGVS